MELPYLWDLLHNFSILIRGFLVDSFAKRGCISTDIRQNNFNVIRWKEEGSSFLLVG